MSATSQSLINRGNIGLKMLSRLSGNGGLGGLWKSISEGPKSPIFLTGYFLKSPHVFGGTWGTFLRMGDLGDF